ncbi:hypothetical protein [Adhaeribacter terreus]|uniref:Uncharacterized protein n=1 Tax=Adhaeribacter terreus TaxID=529703 RepID=A0ABW0ED14_9BACT
MATVKKNIITQGLSGTLGGAIVFRQVGDKITVQALDMPGNRSKETRTL